LATGTTMLYMTPHSVVKIRGKEVVIEVYDRESRIIVVDGDVTVTPQGPSGQGNAQTLHTGQEAVITDSGKIQVTTIDPSLLASLAGQLAAGERAQQLVVFETVPGDNGPEIQANAVVPAKPPVSLSVSPATLPAGG